MGKIKTFKGRGPNPNVPFSNLTDARFVGNTERAASKAVQALGNQAADYFKKKKDQKDTADFLKAETDRLGVIRTLKQETFDNDTGTYNLESFQDKINEFENTIKEGMSPRAYDAYQKKYAIKNQTMFDSLFYENQAVERKNNVASIKKSAESLYGSIAVASFDEMDKIQNTARDGILAGISSGALTGTEAADLVEAGVSSAVKQTMELTLKSDAKNMADLQSRTDRLNQFLETDPLNYFKGEPTLKEAYSRQVVEYYDKQSDSILKDSARNAKLADDLEVARKRRTKLKYTKSYSDISKMSDGVEKREAFAEFRENLNEAVSSGELPVSTANSILNTNYKAQAVADKSLVVSMRMDPENATNLYRQMSEEGQEAHREEYEKVLGASGAYKEAAKIFKEAAKPLYKLPGSSNIETIEKTSAMTEAFDVNFQANFSGTKAVSEEIVVLKTLRDNLGAAEFNNYIQQKARSLQKASAKNIPLEQIIAVLKGQISILDTKVQDFKNSNREGSE